MISLFAVFTSILAFARVTSGACPTLPNPLPAATSLPIITTLPNPWQFFDGTPLKSTADWACRKAEIKTLVQEYFYGYYPDHSLETVTATRSGNSISITVKAGGKSATFGATLTFPSGGASAAAPVPVMINPGLIDNNAFLSVGVALATFDVNTIASDSASKTGAFWTLYAGRDIGVLTAWAWGYHRVLDALIQVAPEIDHNRVGATGCSRWGKGALAAGIFDERITLSLPMSSGIEGIGPWRFFFESGGANEKIENIFGVYPYWSSTRLGQFVNDSRQLPFDAHFLASLVAPRAILWDEGQIDYWTNPQGEASVTFPGTQAVYKWLGAGDKVGVAIRNSGHCDNSGYTNIQDFMKKVFFNTTTTRDYTNIAPYTPFTSAFPWAASPP
ncbi:hypothetical protein BD779DRAFT_504185 [Infundibulicybe gibba]|nr:hypothetical protein BD779DRAFT_504185 [Infundibulicybe gibba]